MHGRLSLRAPRDPLQAAVDAALDLRLDRRSDGPIALGLSGGGDSLALLHLTADWCARAGRPLLALTIDHGLHPHSAAWTARAGCMSAEAGARWRALPWDGSKPLTGLPAAARRARHALLAEAAREAQAHVILLGHTADDAAEGDAMRAAEAPTLGRLRQWAPSPAWPEGRGVFLLRPLLAVGRRELRDWLSGRGLAWHDDPANDDLRYARARVRAAGVTRAAPPASEPLGFGAAGADGIVRLGRAALAGPGSRRSLAAALACAAGAREAPRGPVLNRLLLRLTGTEDHVATAHGARVISDAAGVVIGRELGRAPPPDVALPPGEPVVWDGRFVALAGEEGWSVGAAGGRRKRMSAADRLALDRLPAAFRAAAPVFVRGVDVRLAGCGLTLHGLVPDRFDAAIGRIRREAQLPR